MSAVVDAVAAVQEAVRSGWRVLPVGGGTKPALSTPVGDVAALDVSGLRGIVEYDPAELTLTALAGTPVAEVQRALSASGQYLPFDPPRASAGATLAGVVAAGTSGPNAWRHGGVRDFVIGVRFVDGTGRLVHGGGRVVKNAAGFDLPKLMVGSMGRLGVIVELSLKVFPRPRATATLLADLGSLERALEAMAALARGPQQLEALDLEPPGRLHLRLGGDAAGLPERCDRLAGALGVACERVEGAADAELWAGVAELPWGPPLVKVATTARAVPELQPALERAGARVRYSLAANVAWVAGAQPDALDAELRALGLTGVVLEGPPGRPLLGVARGGAFAERVRGALDPHGRFAR